jgi:hypothetical protein
VQGKARFAGELACQRIAEQCAIGLGFEGSIGGVKHPERYEPSDVCMRLEFRPAAEAVLTSDHELRVMEREATRPTKTRICSETAHSLWVAAASCLQQRTSAIALVFEVEPAKLRRALSSHRDLLSRA